MVHHDLSLTISTLHATGNTCSYTSTLWYIADEPFPAASPLSEPFPAGRIFPAMDEELQQWGAAGVFLCGREELQQRELPEPLFPARAFPGSRSLFLLWQKIPAAGKHSLGKQRAMEGMYSGTYPHPIMQTFPWSHSAYSPSCIAHMWGIGDGFLFLVYLWAIWCEYAIFKIWVIGWIHKSHFMFQFLDRLCGTLTDRFPVGNLRIMNLKFALCEYFVICTSILLSELTFLLVNLFTRIFPESTHKESRNTFKANRKTRSKNNHW